MPVMEWQSDQKWHADRRDKSMCESVDRPYYNASSSVIRALIATARCKQHAIWFVSPCVLLSNFIPLTSNLGFKADLDKNEREML